MPSQIPIARAPSFNPTIYPFQLILTLSTSTPPSTLSLPRHQYKEEADSSPDRRLSESIRFIEDAGGSRNSEITFGATDPWLVVLLAKRVDL